MDDLTSRPIRALLDEATLEARIKELGAQITSDYRDRARELMVVGVLKGSFMFMADLVRAIDLPLACDFMRVSSYEGRESKGIVRFEFDTTQPVTDKHVILVEDIIDTGLTMQYLLETMATRRVASVKVCALLHKREKTEHEFDIDYLGFEIPDEFVIGYGLDLDGVYRNLPYVGVLDPSEVV